MKSFLLCLLEAALVVCSQLLFKLAAQNRTLSSLPDFARLVFSPYMISALLFCVASTLLWVYLLTKVPLSFAYPIQALVFPLVTAVSFFLFGENVPPQRWVGLGIIVVGAFVASR
jgi:drug/metabolite transporter (DMT)-like permease